MVLGLEKAGLISRKPGPHEVCGPARTLRRARAKSRDAQPSQNHRDELLGPCPVRSRFQAVQPFSPGQLIKAASELIDQP
jgi:hypothetical protein